MKRLSTLLLFGVLLTACTNTRLWIAEDESGAAKIAYRGDSIEMTASAGLAAWYPERLTGDYRITFTVEVAAWTDRSGPISGFDCIWACSDPEHPDDFFARSAWRGGTPERYGTLDLFCASFGDGGDHATRFRRFYGKLDSLPDNMSRPIQREYTDAKYLLQAERSYRMEISVSKGTTAFSIDGERLFLRALGPKEGEGYFGFLLFSNRIMISGLKIEHL